ncbi:LmeA family phospholipid-binding protein [Nostoc sp. CMAA1605]|uniref:LmeA family phospholipid-binding protein n=1 Tax=Nostoc sp. CMAA1605 TaxID=2055159 RepID=UPI001F26E51A|nr:DUF2993 domain-containing protein [Nostoc sp. CMAA1605]MCF4967741.1 DUF2993 domain-containing protein [Nostoc sp. CMAA1605]
MSDQKSLDKQIISQVAETSIANQLEAAEQIDIYVETDILKIVQGQADGVTFAGQGLVTKENIRLQEIKLQTDNIDINPFGAIFGQIQLNKPVNLMARVTLTEADLNQALNSQFSRKLVQKFQVSVDGKVVDFDLQKMQISLHSQNHIELQGKVQFTENNHNRSLGFTVMLRPRTHSHPIILESFNCTQGEGISLDLIVSLMQKFQELTNLPYFQLEDINLSIKNMEIQQGKIILLIEANVNKIPDSVTQLLD